ncbi:MAG TPA: hypothetical protein PK808_12690, partial [Polymorphobacter sp.]|nr:hypothetical protein [Polymorphobacter sp.]
LWGVWHATLVAGHRILSPMFKDFQGRTLTVIGWALTLGLVMVGWIPFRAPSLDYTFRLWARAFDVATLTQLGLRETTYIIAALMLVVTIAAPFARDGMVALRRRAPVLTAPPMVLAWTGLMMLVIVYLRPISQFIYFQF